MIRIQSKRLTVMVKETQFPTNLDITIFLNSKATKINLLLNYKLEDIETKLDLEEVLEKAVEDFYINQYLYGTDSYIIEDLISYHEFTVSTNAPIMQIPHVPINIIMQEGKLEKELMISDLKCFGFITSPTLLACEAIALLRPSIKWQDVWY